MNWVAMLPIGRGMCKTIDISGHPLEVRCTSRAMRAITNRQTVLVAEMELAFACFARKQVRFHDLTPEQQVTYITDKLAVRRSAVIPEYCESESSDERSSPKPAIVAQIQNFSPRWLSIDYRDGQWIGDYGL